MREAYLDNSATTPLCDEAREKMLEAMDSFGNPSSLHAKGFDASRMVAEARESILASIGVRGGKSENLIFTSCGTEADNLALRGVAYAKARRASKIITTDSEHSAIENTLLALEADGFTVVRIPTRGGVLDMDAFEREMDKSTLLVSMMYVNNETGAVYDIKKCFAYAKQINPDVVTHTDAVQAYMKMKVSPSDLGADLITLSAHKIHGPKGIGALYVSPSVIKKKQLKPIIYGGGQENGFRSGTENVIGIVGFGAAARAGMKTLSQDVAYMRDLRNYAISQLTPLELKINQPIGECAPHIISITLPGIRSETMLHYLSSFEVYVSSGSACASNSAQKHTSRALIAFGITDADADSTVRISLSKRTTQEDIDTLVSSLSQGIKTLVRTGKH